MAWKPRVSATMEMARRPGGGLLIDFFDQSAFNKLTRNFGYAGRGKLALFRNLDTRDGAVLIDEPIDGRAVQLFYEIDVTNLSLSACCHTFTYSVTTSLPLTMVLVIL